MNINIYKKRLRSANRKQRDLESKLKGTKKSYKISRKRIERQLRNLKQGKVNLRKKINKMRSNK